MSNIFKRIVEECVEMTVLTNCFKFSREKCVETVVLANSPKLFFKSSIFYHMDTRVAMHKVTTGQSMVLSINSGGLFQIFS